MQDNINATHLGSNEESTRTVNHYCLAPPPCVYPPSTQHCSACDQIFQALPFPPYFCKWSKIGSCWQTITTVYRKCVALHVCQKSPFRKTLQPITICERYIINSSQRLTVGVTWFFFLLCAEFVWHQCQEWSHENPTSYSGNWRAFSYNWKAGGLWRWAELCRQWWKHTTTYSADQKECTACHC